MKALQYAYDFVAAIFDDPEAKKYIKNIMLFGSVATGAANKASDVDIFIDTSEAAAKKVEQIAKEAERSFYLTSGKKWSLLGIELPIRFIVDSIDSHKWKEIKSEIISVGIVLYGKFGGVKEGLKHYTLFVFSISGLKQNKKMEFIRNLYGYSQKSGQKIYSRPGLLQELSGLKLGSESILVPAEKSIDIHKFFLDYKITPEIREVWVKD